MIVNLVFISVIIILSVPTVSSLHLLRKQMSSPSASIETMKAVRLNKYGPPETVLEYTTDMTKPRITKPDQCLVKVHASSVNSCDWRLMRADPFVVRLENGLFRPKTTVLGADIAGVIEAVGEKVTKFKPGDEVMADLSASGGRGGGFAEYVCAPGSALVKKPPGVSFLHAAAVPLAGVTALQALRDKGKIQKDHKVLINGASSGVGSLAVQLAKHFGAEVTAVCSGDKMDMFHEMKVGAPDYTIDYKKEDFTKNGKQYDLILDVAAFRALSDVKKSLTPKTGKCVVVGGSLKNLMKAMIWGGKQIEGVVAQPNEEDMTYLATLLEKGEIVPYIDREYVLKDVPSAIQYMESRQVKGKIVINNVE